MVKVGIIGAGYIATTHLQVLQNLPFAEITCVCDIDQKKAQKLAKQYKAKAYTNYQQIIDEKLVDYVHILVPPSLHKKLALPFLEAGINVFLEKPMAETEQDCQELIEAANKTNCRFFINHSFAFNPAF